MESLDLQQSVSDALIELGNQLADDNPDADIWEIADGILSGAVHWWLYANSPCGTPGCEDCAEVANAELRMATLHRLVAEMAESSEYYHSSTDDNVAHA
ncbi:MAG: hypothetical protein HKN58_06265 [Xanthomonadales bacterium]|nr:hypothetical protein [Xanthomonadales bacterium]